MDGEPGLTWTPVHIEVITIAVLNVIHRQGLDSVSVFKWILLTASYGDCFTILFVDYVCTSQETWLVTEIALLFYM
jgi:hypothetical protein